MDRVYVNLRRLLTNNVSNVLRWKKAAENVMEVQLLETNRHSFVKPERQGSLYDETPLFGNMRL